MPLSPGVSYTGTSTRLKERPTPNHVIAILDCHDTCLSHVTINTCNGELFIN